jgi:hypothetical protein
MRVLVSIQLDGVPPLAQQQVGRVEKQLVYERDVRDYERFEEGVRAYLLNELPLLFREALEEFRGILPEAPPEQSSEAAPVEAAPVEEPSSGQEAPRTDAPEQAVDVPPA